MLKVKYSLNARLPASPSLFNNILFYCWHRRRNRGGGQRGVSPAALKARGALPPTSAKINNLLVECQHKKSKSFNNWSQNANCGTHRRRNGGGSGVDAPPTLKAWGQCPRLRQKIIARHWRGGVPLLWRFRDNSQTVAASDTNFGIPYRASIWHRGCKLC